MKNGYSIVWTYEAEKNLSAIFDYLEKNLSTSQSVVVDNVCKSMKISNL